MQLNGVEHWKSGQSQPFCPFFPLFFPFSFFVVVEVSVVSRYLSVITRRVVWLTSGIVGWDHCVDSTRNKSEGGGR